MILAVDLGGTHVKLGMVADGVLVDEDRILAPATLRELGAVADLGRRMIATHTGSGVRVTRAGVAVPGVVDPRSGRLTSIHDKYAYLVGFDLPGWATEELGLPVVIENDARAALLGEVEAVRTGGGAAVRDAAIVITGTGIGTAVLADGAPLVGPEGYGGVLGGHFTVDLDGPPCNCGNIGCAEAIGGSWNLAAQVRAVVGWERSTLADAGRDDSMSMAVLFGAAASGDAVATGLADRVVDAWAATAVNLCHAYQPELLIFSGGPMRAAAGRRDALADAVRARLWSSLRRPEVRFAESPEHSVVRGLAVLAERKDAR
ncbi:ROK family protein [Promicromonospora panici]|uniref:ROK family protein n=1 Tax=Promicromonospora panici TaxID=2219658 RepID=UPI001F5DF86D|nr:ROK family protein [Promicromonospora panici]